MTKFSRFINALGTAGPLTLQGIYNLGFALRSEVPALLAKYLRVDATQDFTTGEKLQGRTNLDLGTIATQDADDAAITGGSITGIVDLAIADGGTGASTAPAARNNLGLGNVDNTADAAKPVSTATQTALNLKANLSSPAFTGVPAVPTAAPGTSTTQAASTAFVETAVVGAVKGYRFGLTLSKAAANVIGVAAGTAVDTTGAKSITLASAITKNLAAVWAVGSGNGGMDTGAIADGSYHAFAIERLDTGVEDVLISLSATAPTLPANYTLFRRIGSFIRAAGEIFPFTQSGNYFYYDSYATDLTTTGAAADALLALTVPSGIVVLPIMEIRHTANVNTTTDVLVGGGNIGGAGMMLLSYSGVSAFVSVVTLCGLIRTNIARQIRYSIIIGSGSVLSSFWRTWGYIDVDL